MYNICRRRDYHDNRRERDDKRGGGGGDRHDRNRRDGDRGMRKRSPDACSSKSGRAGPIPVKKSKDDRGVRYLDILLFVVVMQTYCLIIVGGMYTSQDPRLAAYDCSQISNVELRSAACLHDRMEPVRSVELLGLAETDFILSEAISCEVRLKLERWFCGTASHVHVLDVPHEKQVELSMDECRRVFHSGKYQHDGISFKVNIDLPTVHSFTVNGTLSPFWDVGGENIQCKTLGIYAHNMWFNLGFAIGTLHILVKNTPVLIKGNVVMDYDKKTIVANFEDNHLWATSTSPYFPYVVRKPASNFKVVFQDTFNLTTWNEQLFVSNLERNILVKIMGTEKLTLQHLDFNIFVTELEGIKFLEEPKAAVRSYFGDLLKQEARFDLNAMFLASRERNERMMELFSISRCAQTEVRSNVQLHHGFRIIYLGEIAKYEKCTAVEIPVKLGVDYGCAVGHLLVDYKGETVGIQEYSRMIVAVEDIKLLNCSQSPVFLKLTANLFLGNQGQGLELLHIANEKSEHVGQKIFLNDEKVFIADFNKTIKYQGLEDFEDFNGQASKLDFVDHKLSFFEQVTGPWFGLEHLFKDILPLFAKFVLIVLMLLLGIIPMLALLYCCCSWCHKKRFTEEEFNARS